MFPLLGNLSLSGISRTSLGYVSVSTKLFFPLNKMYHLGFRFGRINSGSHESVFLTDYLSQIPFNSLLLPFNFLTLVVHCPYVFSAVSILLRAASKVTLVFPWGFVFWSYYFTYLPGVLTIQWETLISSIDSFISFHEFMVIHILDASFCLGHSATFLMLFSLSPHHCSLAPRFSVSFHLFSCRIFVYYVSGWFHLAITPF